MVSFLNCYLFFGQFRIRANGAHTYALLQSYNFNTWKRELSRVDMTVIWNMFYQTTGNTFGKSPWSWVTKTNCVPRIWRERMVWTSLKNALFNSRTASVRNFEPQNCQRQVYWGSQINRDMEILCGRPLMTWPPMMININMGVAEMRHCFIAKLPYPLVLHTIFFWKRWDF